MDLGFEKTNRVQSALRGNGGDRDRRPDWYGLRARLFAIRSARHAMEEQVFRAGIRSDGSFDHDSALLLATYGSGLCPVNPTALGNGNPDGAIDALVTGANRTGDRG